MIASDVGLVCDLLICLERARHENRKALMSEAWMFFSVETVQTT